MSAHKPKHGYAGLVRHANRPQAHRRIGRARCVALTTAMSERQLPVPRFAGSPRAMGSSAGGTGPFGRHIVPLLL